MKKWGVTMNKKWLLLIVFVLITIVSFGLYFMLDLKKEINEDENEILKANKKDESETALTVVTFGKRPFYDNVYFIQNESLNDEELDKYIEKHRYFIFDEKRFIEFTKKGLVEELIKKGKTVLFHDTSGKGLDVKNILSNTDLNLPIHEVVHDSELYILLYGYGYSKKYNTIVPISVLTNTLEGNKDKQKMEYLIEHDLEHFSD